MQTFVWSDLNASQREAALARPAAMLDDTVITSVKAIMADVRARGDDALRDFTAKFDGATLTDIRVPAGDLEAAWDDLDAGDKIAMKTAKANIEAFHAAQMPAVINMDVMPGVTCRREPRALDSAGLYVPGGTAPLVSTMIVPKVAKIFGPGNAWVATAKSLAAQEPGGPAIDLPAGPSEAMVCADDEANAVFVASDLLSQAEHDKVAQVVAVVKSKAYADKLSEEIERQVATLPRVDIARASLKSGRIFIAPDDDAMLDIINAYAPEHLILQTQNAESLVKDIRNAGSVFVGQWTPESVGDYASGTNHTLPTYGAARAYSGVTLESFMTYMSVQTLTRAGLEALGPTVERLADMEGLEAHRRAVSLRLESKA